MIKKNTNIIFGITSLNILTMIGLSVPCAVYLILPMFTDTQLSDGAVFWLSFGIPQFFYPILSVTIALMALSIAKIRPGEVITTEKPQILTAVTAIMIFPALAEVASIISSLIMKFTEHLGLSSPNTTELIESFIIGGPGQAIFTIIVIAILPAICEEIIYRGVIFGVLKKYSPSIAIIVSAIAFSITHATIEQIPSAFLIGLFLGYVYSITRSITLTMLLHFINNFTACIFLLAENYATEQTLYTINTIYIFTITLSAVVALAILIFRLIRNKSSRGKYALPTGSMRPSAAVKEIIHAPCFWLYMIIYILLTIGNCITSMLT